MALLAPVAGDVVKTAMWNEGARHRAMSRLSRWACHYVGATATPRSHWLCERVGELESQPRHCAWGANTRAYSAAMLASKWGFRTGRFEKLRYH